MRRPVFTKIRGLALAQARVCSESSDPPDFNPLVWHLISKANRGETCAEIRNVCVIEKRFECRFRQRDSVSLPFLLISLSDQFYTYCALLKTKGGLLQKTHWNLYFSGFSLFFFSSVIRSPGVWARRRVVFMITVKLGEKWDFGI